MGSNSHAPVGSIDRPVLVAIEQRLQTASHIEQSFIAPKQGTATLTAAFDTDYFPAAVVDAYYDIRWYTSGDFEIHYQENWSDGSWQRPWDRHPRDGQRTHYHPPPDAGRPPVPETMPNSFHEVLRDIEQDTIDHIKNHPQHSA